MLRGIQTTGSTESPCWVYRSPRSNCNSSLSGNSDNKRKTVHRWTEQVRACEQTGFTRPIEDGYSWRQYGKKDIVGAKHPRGYSQCAHKNAQDCLAMKQVQRTNENSSIFNVMYRGKHTYFSQLQIENSGTTQKVLRSPSFSFPTVSTPIPCIERKSNNNIFTSMTSDHHFMSYPFSSPYLSPSTSKSNSFSPYRMQD
ncbi:hypothetical protein MKW98_005034 [Papaver atlanticum]|uniref:WRKY domain-containing protein n=1 Tax=Papaver atlanticum TaxID=357466 RepID=A0AAD4XTR6_9MAGN|nr:hypothetical protein MKW98_005034 [Papaver atlanticum]